MRDPAASRATMMRRAVRCRCPRCGAPDVFATYLELLPRCPSCGLAFEREPGYWVGAMIIITTITFGLFVVLLAGGMIVFWPDVPWGWLLGVTIAANVAVPILAYPIAKTIWSAMELSWHPLEPHEVSSADAYLRESDAS